MLWRRGKAYSQDLRERVLAAADEGERVGQRQNVAGQCFLRLEGVEPAAADGRDDGVAATLPRAAQGGQRLVAAVPHGHWKTSTVVAALRCDGVSATGVFDGAINGEAFLAFVEQALVPTLKSGDVLIMDKSYA